MLDKPTPTFDCRAICRKTVQHWGVIRFLILDLHGRAVGEVRALNPANAPIEPGKARPRNEPQFKEFRGPSPYEKDGAVGAWLDGGTGASGPDAVSIIEYLSGGCDRRVAADYLKRLTDRMVEVA
jgi:hypothetical protein